MKSVTDRVEQLRRTYSRQLPDRIRELERMWHRFVERREPLPLAAMLESTHNLTGSGGVYGYPRVSSISRELHQTLLNIKHEGGAPSSDQRLLIEERIGELLREVTPR
ncbi:MAG TPA: hypothetical protein ENJ43_04025 [Gammaproteobacteria bacterium]|nr:hypothetical protein [Gammaproteobacteria bacterium]